jgi:hypothetical protein
MKRCLILCLALTGCMTVVQKPVKPLVSSYDNNVQNSGVIAKNEYGFQVTAHFKDRYNSLISIYGNVLLQDGTPVFTPSLVKDTGVTDNKDGTYTLTKQAMANMIIMSKLQREGFKP